MKCPFVERECVEHECRGWSNGSCFIENQGTKVNELENIISKLLLSKAKLESRTDLIDISTKKEQWESIETPLPNDENIIAIDFGTAFSKVAYRTGNELAIPIPLKSVAVQALKELNTGIDIETSNHYFVEDSILYIDNDSNILCGTSANIKSIQESSAGNIRPALRNLKQLLIGGGAGLPVPNYYFPTSTTLTLDEILAVYLAYILNLANRFSKSLNNGHQNTDSFFKNFSIPVWNNQQYRDIVQNMLRNAIMKAFCLERWLGNKLISGLPISLAKEALTESEKYLKELREHTLGINVTEPVAAGYTRIADLDIKPGRPYHIFIVDVGAGSTDFAFYTVSQPVASTGKLLNISKIQDGVNKGVATWDSALMSILRARAIKDSGLDSNSHQNQVFRVKVDYQLQRLKEDLLAYGVVEVDASPILNKTLRINKDELEQSLAVVNAISEINTSFRNFIGKITSTFSKDHFEPSRTEILITGGGSFVKQIVDSLRDASGILGPGFERRIIDKFIPVQYSSFANMNISYPMLAVSLGSTERNYPVESNLPLVGKFIGAHTLEKIPTKGN